MSKKILWSLYLDVEQTERLKELSTRTRVPQAAYIREAIDLVLNKYSRKVRKKRINSKFKIGKHTSLRLRKK